MKQRKVPLRTCVVSNEKCEKKDLLRVVRNNEGQVFVDDTNKANGRGAYLKRDLETFDKAEKSKILNKRLEVEVPASVYEELRNKVGA